MNDILRMPRIFLTYNREVYLNATENLTNKNKHVLSVLDNLILTV